MLAKAKCGGSSQFCGLNFGEVVRSTIEVSVHRALLEKQNSTHDDKSKTIRCTTFLIIHRGTFWRRYPFNGAEEPIAQAD